MPGGLIGGRYRLVSYLARGGMAEVWLATHESLKSEVAIKFIDPALARGHTSAIERFRFEAQVSARLSARTKHIVAVHDAGEHEGIPYLVMEFVAGHTLERELEEKGPLSPERFADLLDQIADALSVAHEVGIVHRDLKPSNLMLIDEPDGSTLFKVADFGIAKVLRGDIPLDRPKETALGEMIGSPAYMSPEQIDGCKDLDARSDLWSLGVLAYEALTAEPCFGRGASMTELLVSISTLQYKPMSRLRPELPKAVDVWLARILATRPEDRFHSVAELAQAFRVAIATSDGKRQRRGWVIAVTGLLISSVIATLVTFFMLRSSKPASVASATSVLPEPVTTAVAPRSPSGAPQPPPGAPLGAPYSTSSSSGPAPSLQALAPLPSSSSSSPLRGRLPAPTATAQVTVAPSATTPVKPRPSKERDPSETL